MAQRSRVEPDPPPNVRLTTSSSAADRLSTVRLRRLLAIELDGVVAVDPSPDGTLEGERIRVWVDVPTPDRALIEVRRSGRSLARRVVALASFSADVAARVVVFEAAEMVRVQARPAYRPTDPDADAGHADDEVSRPHLLLGASYEAAVLPGADPVALFGPGLRVGHGSRYTAQHVFANVLMGFDDGSPVRWLELGGSLAARLPLSPSWRLHAGARAGLVALAFADDADLGAGDATAITGRAAGQLGVETLLTGRTWLTLDVEPGALLSGVEATYANGETGSVSGFSLGLRLGLSYAAPLDP